MKASDRTQALYAQFFDFKPSKGDQKRIAILEATIDLLASHEGVENVSFESIGKKTNMLRAHVAYYFPNRNELIASAIKFVVGVVQSYTVRAVTEAIQSQRDPLHAFVEGTFSWLQDYPKHPRVILLLYYFASIDSQYRKLNRDVRTLGHSRIQAIVEPKLSTSHQKRSSEIALAIQNIMTGILVNAYTTAANPPLKPLKETMLNEIETCLSPFKQ